MSQLVSIIMPCYNAAPYIAQSIDSVLAQTYEDWELLITDDGSTDKSVDIIQAYCDKDERIRLERSETHCGPGTTRNKAMARARGQYIAFLDADDLWLPDKLERQMAFMTENHYGFTFTGYELISEKGDASGKTVMTDEVMDHKKYLRNTIIGCSTVMLDTAIVGEVRMTRDDTSDDMTLWLELMHRGFKAYPLDLVLAKHRIRKDSASSNKFKATRDVWRVYRVNEGMPLLKSMYCFMGYAYNAIKKRIP